MTIAGDLLPPRLTLLQRILAALRQLARPDDSIRNVFGLPSTGRVAEIKRLYNHETKKLASWLRRDLE